MSATETSPAVATVATEDAVRAELATQLLRAGMRVEAKVSDVQALAENGAARVDVVVIGCDRIDLEVADSIGLVRESLGDTRVVVAASVLTRRTLRQALGAGADGVVSPGVASALGPAIRAACAGLLSVPRDLGVVLSRPALSAREKQALGMVVLGFTNGEIARKLHLAESTVKSHLSSAFSKLGVRSRSEATALILDPEHGFGAGILAISEYQGSGGEGRLR
jgi:two-component system response regulator DesR